MIFLVITRRVEVGKLRLGAQGVNCFVFAVLRKYLRVLADCGVDILEGLHGVALAAMFFADTVPTVSPFSGPCCLKRHGTGFVVAFALLVDAGASCRREKVVTPSKC